MPDPAVEAVQRSAGHRKRSEQLVAERAVREALKPIRTIHSPRPISAFSTARMTGAAAECSGCNRAWPCATARLIYTTEELNHA
jgi:hypothetical protein